MELFVPAPAAQVYTCSRSGRRRCEMSGARFEFPSETSEITRDPAFFRGFSPAPLARKLLPPAVEAPQQIRCRPGANLISTLVCRLPEIGVRVRGVGTSGGVTSQVVVPWRPPTPFQSEYGRTLFFRIVGCLLIA